MKIKELRARTGLSQSQFAKKVGIPLCTLQNWERDRTTPPPYIPEMIEKILTLEAGAAKNK